MQEVLNILLDVGLGAIALRLTSQLSAVVNGLKTMVADHEQRITALEKQ